MIKALLIIFSTVNNGGSDIPTIIPFDSMESCVNAKTHILEKYGYTGFFNSGRHDIFTDAGIDCLDIGPK